MPSSMQHSYSHSTFTTIAKSIPFRCDRHFFSETHTPTPITLFDPFRLDDQLLRWPAITTKSSAASTGSSPSPSRAHRRTSKKRFLNLPTEPPPCPAISSSDFWRSTRAKWTAPQWIRSGSSSNRGKRIGKVDWISTTSSVSCYMTISIAPSNLRSFLYTPLSFPRKIIFKQGF